jgi:uncharacterized protein (TIGR03435 family)
MSAIEVFATAPWVARLGWTLVHFIWQGAVTAAVYGAARAALRGAVARYGLACAALAAMMAAPVATWVWLGPGPGTPDEVYRIHSTPAPVSRETGTVAVAIPVAARVDGADILPWVVMVWFAGAAAFGIRLAGGCVLAGRMRSRQVRPAPAEWQQRFERLQSRLGVARARLLVSGLADAPAVVGWWKPVVLAPIGALSGLAPEAVEALLAHELAHIRRHDYLVNTMQSVVEALLFYHPAVWWVSGHMRAEREHCCDDVAVAMAGDALTYARALAEVEARRAPAARLAMSAAGGSLAQRIARVLGRPPASSGGTAPALLLVVLGIAISYGLFAQTETRPAFQAASIKKGLSNLPRQMIVRPEPGGILRAENATLLLLIQNAYRLQAFQVVGGPDWINTEGYNIEAKPDGPVDREQMWKMAQTLLAERFHLALHRETRDVAGYALIAAKGGPKLPPTKEGACTAAPADLPVRPPEPGMPGPCGRLMINMSPNGLRVSGGRVRMAELVRILGVVSGRPVLDRTGAGGEFDVALTFTPDDITMGLPGAGGPPAMRPQTDPEKPNLLAALQEQLGLKLTAAKAPVEVVVIDHVERPTAN